MNRSDIFFTLAGIDMKAMKFLVILGLVTVISGFLVAGKKRKYLQFRMILLK